MNVLRAIWQFFKDNELKIQTVEWSIYEQMNDWICNTISRVSEKINSVWWYDEKVLLERKMIPDSKEKAIKEIESDISEEMQK